MANPLRYSGRIGRRKDWIITQGSARFRSSEQNSRAADSLIRRRLLKNRPQPIIRNMTSTCWETMIADCIEGFLPF